MDLKDFKASLEDTAPPDRLGPELKALWHQARGEWETAHRLAQAVDSKAAAWVHAHLHRVEGDESNAAYWYRRAGQDYPSVSLKEELETIVEALS